MDDTLAWCLDADVPFMDSLRCVFLLLLTRPRVLGVNLEGIKW